MYHVHVHGRETLKILTYFIQDTPIVHVHYKMYMYIYMIFRKCCQGYNSTFFLNLFVKALASVIEFEASPRFHEQIKEKMSMKWVNSRKHEFGYE